MRRRRKSDKISGTFATVRHHRDIFHTKNMNTLVSVYCKRILEDLIPPHTET